MKIWLPPSEGKTAPVNGPRLDLGALAFPELTDTREALVTELIATSAREDAALVLGLGARARAELATNLALRENPVAPAHRLFTGVLFNAARLPELTGESLAAAEGVLRVFSGLFGVLTPLSPVPDHRLAMSVKLPGSGALTSTWRDPLDAVLREDAGDEVVLDMRSGPYRQACPAPWAHVWSVAVVRESEGVRKTISHDAKRWRGLLVAHLLGLGDQVRALDEGSLPAHLGSFTETDPVLDAKGVAHRVRAVEISAATTTRRGGSHREITIVTD